MAKVTQQFLQGRPVVVTLRGGGEIECQAPDPLELMTQNVFPLAVYAHVLEVLKAWADAGTGPSLPDETRKDPIAWLNFMDRWAIAAARTPRIVATPVEADGLSAICVDDFDMDDKVAIFGATNRRFKSALALGEALKEFRCLRSEGAVAGPNGEALLDAAVDVAGRA
jgi:hypothetical protein